MCGFLAGVTVYFVYSQNTFSLAISIFFITSFVNIFLFFSFKYFHCPNFIDYNLNVWPEAFKWMKWFPSPQHCAQHVCDERVDALSLSQGFKQGLHFTEILLVPAAGSKQIGSSPTVTCKIAQKFYTDAQPGNQVFLLPVFCLSSIAKSHLPRVIVIP